MSRPPTHLPDSDLTAGSSGTDLDAPAGADSTATLAGLGSASGPPAVLLQQADSGLLAAVPAATASVVASSAGAALMTSSAIAAPAHDGNAGGGGQPVTPVDNGMAAVQSHSGQSGHLTINVSFDASVNNAPAGFTAAVNDAVQFFENQFTDPIAININVGFGEVGGQALGQGALGESESFLTSPFTYSQIKNALAADAKSGDDMTAVANLPNADPTGGGNFTIATAEAKALGLMGTNAAADGDVGFSSTAPFTYDPNNRAVAGDFDFIGTVEHEISEVMGRFDLLGTPIGNTPNTFSVLDLFRYSAPGAHNFTGTQPSYFSVDGGNTNLDNFNTDPNGDFGDWAASAGNDSFLAFSNSGVMNAVSQADIRQMDVLGYDTVPTSSVPGKVVGVGDFNNDGTSDILFNNNGAISIWEMNNDQVLARLPIAQVGSTWQVNGVGDFNGDHMSDILWRNGDGTTALWEMNGGQVLVAQAFGQIGLQWHVVGIGDINGDGKSDIFWQATDGTMAVWEMNGTQVVLTQAFANIGSQWHVIGVNDFNGDGKADILFRDATDGTTGMWLMNGTQVLAAQAFGQIGLQWSVAGTGDFNGDGKSDILWVAPDGTVAMWEMNGVQVVAAGAFAQMGTQWHVAGIGDFNHDGKSDLLWQSSDGSLQIWDMNGMQISSTQTFGASRTGTAGAQPQTEHAAAPNGVDPHVSALQTTASVTSATNGTPSPDPLHGLGNAANGWSGWDQSHPTFDSAAWSSVNAGNVIGSSHVPADASSAAGLTPGTEPSASLSSANGLHLGSVTNGAPSGLVPGGSTGNAPQVSGAGPSTDMLGGTSADGAAVGSPASPSGGSAPGIDSLHGPAGGLSGSPAQGAGGSNSFHSSAPDMAPGHDHALNSLAAELAHASSIAGSGAGHDPLPALAHDATAWSGLDPFHGSNHA